MGPSLRPCESASERSGGRSPGARRGSQEGRIKLRAGADLELVIRVAQVHLDRLDGDKERLRDLLVGHPLGCELYHATLARGKGVDPSCEDFSRPRTSGGDLFVRVFGEPERADRLREVDAFTQPLARLGSLVRAAESRA
jgi:hypothetical protein